MARYGVSGMPSWSGIMRSISQPSRPPALTLSAGRCCGSGSCIINSRSTNRMHRLKRKGWAGISLIAMLLLAGCAKDSTIYQDASVQIPALPQSARQPDLPPECLPTCTQGLMRLRESMLQQLMDLE